MAEEGAVERHGGTDPFSDGLAAAAAAGRGVGLVAVGEVERLLGAAGARSEVDDDAAAAVAVAGDLRRAAVAAGAALDDGGEGVAPQDVEAARAGSVGL